MGDKKVCDDIYVGRCKWSFPFLHDHETSPRERIYGRSTPDLSLGNRCQPEMGIYGCPHFSEVSAFSQIREAREGFFLHLLNLKCLQLKINFLPKWLILGWHILILFKWRVTNQMSLFQIRNETWIKVVSLEMKE